VGGVCKTGLGQGLGYRLIKVRVRLKLGRGKAPRNQYNLSCAYVNAGMLPPARQAQIIRANQKDEQHQVFLKSLLGDLVQSCVGKCKLSVCSWLAISY
jgi:hypothetical protein